MSSIIFRKKSIKPESWNISSNMFGRGKAARIALLAAFFAATGTLTANAALFGSSKHNNRTNSKEQPVETVQVKINNFQPQRNINGSNMDSYKFAQTHYGQSKSKLEQICRAISSRYNDSSARDILQKIFVVDTQLYMENIKNSALSVGEILQTSNAIGQGLQDLRQIITSPGQQTLEALDKTIDSVRAANTKQLLLSQKYLSGLESLIAMAQASYETYELIPSLSMNELDLFVQASKQLMNNVKSHGESFKGLVLNIKSSSEQIDNGLSSIKQTVKETLRFSDHFAIKQFPLINLPAPSREKIFVQINSLANTVKGVDNTLSIGDSQVRNSSQQFTHLISSFVDKSAESMKYQKQDFYEKAQTQISSYARNQVCGLYARIKEDMGNMRSDMAKASRASTVPVVNMESKSEYAARKAKSAAETTLPLFLLGGAKSSQGASVASAKATAKSSNSFESKSGFDVTDGFMAMESSNKMANDSSLKDFSEMSDAKGETTVLFSEKDFASAPTDDSGFITSEMNILQQELGSDFFFGDSGENISGSSLMAQGDEDLPNYGASNDYASGSSDDSAEMQISYCNLDGSDDSIEMMRFDSNSLDQENEELIPMMKYDSDVLNFDELNEE